MSECGMETDQRGHTVDLRLQLGGRYMAAWTSEGGGVGPQDFENLRLFS